MRRLQINFLSILPNRTDETIDLCCLMLAVTSSDDDADSHISISDDHSDGGWSTASHSKGSPVKQARLEIGVASALPMCPYSATNEGCTPASTEWLGMTWWASYIMDACAPRRAALGPQTEPVDMESSCSGNGSEIFVYKVTMLTLDAFFLIFVCFQCPTQPMHNQTKLSLCRSYKCSHLQQHASIRRQALGVRIRLGGISMSDKKIHSRRFLTKRHAPYLEHLWETMADQESLACCVLHPNARHCKPSRKNLLYIASSLCDPFSGLRRGPGQPLLEDHQGFGTTFGDHDSVLSCAESREPEIFVLEQVMGFRPFLERFKSRVLSLRRQDGSPMLTACHHIEVNPSHYFAQANRPRLYVLSLSERMGGLSGVKEAFEIVKELNNLSMIER